MKRAFLFPGQGSQFLGMAVDLCAARPEARQVFERGREVLGFDILAICRDGPEDVLSSTRVSQPAIFLHSMAVLEVLGVPGTCGTRIPAAASAGLSLGEYSALVFAGSLAFEDALRLVARRGEYMQEACEERKGSMASVLGLGPREVEEVVVQARAEGLVVGVANYNSPGQTVISGEEAAVAVTTERLKSAGARRVVPLRVAGAYHSPLMSSAARKMENLLRAARITAPRLPFYANVSGEKVENPEQIRLGLVSQVEGSVRWEQSIRAMAREGVTSALEVGCGKVLQGLVRNIERDLQVLPAGTLEDLDNAEVLQL